MIAETSADAEVGTTTCPPPEPSTFITNAQIPVCDKSADPAPDAAAQFLHDTAVDAIVYLAGRQGERRCFRGSAPGWHRHRSEEERRAYHEAGHAVVAHVLGQYVHKLSIQTDESVRVDSTRAIGGFCWPSRDPEPPKEYTFAPRVRGDIYHAADAAKVIALSEPGRYDWRLVLKVARRLRARARDLVERTWYPLIMPLAEELAKRGELDAKQIAQYLENDTRGIADP